MLLQINLADSPYALDDAQAIPTGDPLLIWQISNALSMVSDSVDPKIPTL